MPLVEGTGFILSNSPHQAVRVRFRYGGSEAPCPNGSWDDADDLVFTVAPSVATGLGDSGNDIVAADVPEVTLSSDICEGINRKERCAAVSDLCRWDKKDGCLPLPWSN